MLIEDFSQPRAAYVEEISDDEDSFSESENKDTAEIQVRNKRNDLNSDAERDNNKGTLKKPDFPEIENFIRQSVRELGGAVFPKMNWSSPRVITGHNDKMILDNMLTRLLSGRCMDFSYANIALYFTVRRVSALKVI